MAATANGISEAVFQITRASPAGSMRYSAPPLGADSPALGAGLSPPSFSSSFFGGAPDGGVAVTLTELLGVRSAFADGRPLLSMGMSADFEAALRAGAHVLRIGSAFLEGIRRAPVAREAR